MSNSVARAFNLASPSDSFVKYANDVLHALDDRIFTCVRSEDLNEVKVDFAAVISQFYRADNFRIARLIDEDAFYAQAAKGCCGAWDSQVVCRSGNVYWVGCNYGH